MILIRNRNELHKHLESELAVVKASLRTTPNGHSKTFKEGLIRGLEIALEAIQAWEQEDHSE